LRKTISLDTKSGKITYNSVTIYEPYKNTTFVFGLIFSYDGPIIGIFCHNKIDNVINIILKCYTMNSELIKASFSGNIEQDINLLKIDKNPNQTNQYGNTPLYWAVCSGHFKAVELLLKAGANPKLTNFHEVTPLYTATYYGELEIVKLLLKAGADPNQADINGTVPLYWAAYKGHLEIAKLLLKAGAKSKQANNYREIHLHHVPDPDNLDMIELLKSYENKISSLSLLCLRTIYQKQINTDNIPSIILEWDFHN